LLKRRHRKRTESNRLRKYHVVAYLEQLADFLGATGSQGLGQHPRPVSRKWNQLPLWGTRWFMLPTHLWRWGLPRNVPYVAKPLNFTQEARRQPIFTLEAK
jgi:hypothetical protein